ncbi:MAG: XRE family transcriptional regulator [Acetobacteraceae bacterium]|nr:XRE family transcriptional regulator [Acetobacteraceae bacterium]
MEVADAAATELDTRLAARLASLRTERGWSLDTLADRSGVSRTTLSRLERGETSPTASLLGRLCTAYNRTMSRLIAEAEAEAPQFIRAADQATWVDPETGFRRRGVSPPAAGLDAELVEATLPAGAVIAYAAPPVQGLEQHIWMLGGALELTLDGTVHRLETGDCLRFRLFGASRFAAPGPDDAHYALVVCRP